jgi:hypothetical protein
MLLKVPRGKASPADKEQLNAWWRWFFSGNRNSHRAQALYDDIQVEVVGDTLDQMTSDTLTNQAREDVCAALGVPHSLISADAANYATSQQDTLNFYQQTVLPQADLISEVITDQVLPPGYEFVFDPSQLEVFQQHELAKAQSITALVREPTLTVDEGRDMMGREPLGGVSDQMQEAQATLKSIQARLEELALWTA